MAVNVILSHFVIVYYPEMYFPEYAQDGGLLTLFAKTPLSIFVNGNIAVQFFFVLTGFLVCRSVILNDAERPSLIVEKFINRYFRLVVVAATSILFTFLTMILGIQHHLDAALFTKNRSFFLDYCNFKPTLFNLLYDMFVCLFIQKSLYVGPLWTLRYEFWGYILCYVVCLSSCKIKWRTIVYLLSGLLACTQLSTDYAGFFIGILIADHIYQGKNNSHFLKSSNTAAQSKLTFYICATAGFYLAACPSYLAPLYSVWKHIPSLEPPLLHAFGAGLLLYCVCRSDCLQTVLSHRILVWLGKISYSIYAIHWPIMLSLESGLFLLFQRHMTYDASALSAFFISLPVIYVVSCISWLILERNRKYYPL